MEAAHSDARAAASTGENHYVLVIHGTWNPAVAGSKTWHQLDPSNPQNFCHRLNESLHGLGMGRPVWAHPHPEKKELHFSWTGDNTHEARVKAADDLVKLLVEIEKLDLAARVHLVAHSHGCNVVTAAVQRYLAHLRATADAIVEKAREALESATPEEAWQKGLESYYGDRAAAMLGRTAALAAALKEEMQKALDEEAGRPLARLMRGARSGAALSTPELNRSIAHVTDLWETSRETNRLGSLVLLGAPFYHKLWLKRSWYSFGSIVGTLFDGMVSGAVGFGTAYVVILYFWAIVWGLVWLYAQVASTDYRLPWIGWNPLSWPDWVMWTGAFFLTVYAVGAWALAGGWGLKNVNPYFDREKIGPLRGKAEGPSALPYRTLIVHAGLLDEVLLAFSAEPIVYGVFGPHVRALVKPEIVFRMDAPTAGQSFTFRGAFIRVSGATARFARGILLWCLGPVRGLWERNLTRTLLKIVSAPSFGLPAREFENALIVPDHTLRRPDVFAETVEDVGRVLISTPPVNVKTASAEARAERYSAIWDRTARDNQAEKSWLWKQVKHSFEQIARRHRDAQGGDLSGLEEHLLTTSLVLEERIRELTGVIELVHSSYYTNAEIIDKISRFIAGLEMRAPSVPDDRANDAALVDGT